MRLSLNLAVVVLTACSPEPPLPRPPPDKPNQIVELATAHATPEALRFNPKPHSQTLGCFEIHHEATLAQSKSLPRRISLTATERATSSEVHTSYAIRSIDSVPADDRFWYWTPLEGSRAVAQLGVNETSAWTLKLAQSGSDLRGTATLFSGLDPVHGRSFAVTLRKFSCK